MVEKESDASRIMHELGKLTGSVDSLTDRVSDVREDIRRMHQEQTERVNALRQEIILLIRSSEERIDRRVDNVASRIEKLEAEDKRIIEKVAGIAVASGGVGGGIGGALALGAIEIIKRMF